MKVLSVHDLKPEDSLLLTFDGVYKARTALKTRLAPFLDALEKNASGWMPDVIRGKRQRRYSRPSFFQALDENDEGNNPGIGLYRTEWPALDGCFDLWLSRKPPQLGVFLHVQPLSFFADEQRCLHFVEMVRAWASHYPVTHAAAHSVADRNLADSPCFGRDEQTYFRDGFDKIYEVFWLNVFGPRLVEEVGRERMLSTPAWRVEELPNGCVLLVTWPTAADFASEEARMAQARAHAHLRPDLGFDTVLRTLRERSATLAPVEPRFPPDLAPLLSRVVDAAAVHERQRTIAGLNAWRPPEPEEWLPLDAALPPDVADPERVLEQYRLHAEYLVALLHTPVPSVFKATPESLTDVDAYFWRDDFTRGRSREAIDERLVPAVGAYLGEVLVEHLDGRWIPRKKLMEAQVLAGGRVWLPMKRAWRYLRSRQSLLDCSLTQLYREAERHRS